MHRSNTSSTIIAPCSSSLHKSFPGSIYSATSSEEVSHPVIFSSGQSIKSITSNSISRGSTDNEEEEEEEEEEELPYYQKRSTIQLYIIMIRLLLFFHCSITFLFLISIFS